MSSAKPEVYHVAARVKTLLRHLAAYSLVIETDRQHQFFVTIDERQYYPTDVLLGYFPDEGTVEVLCDDKEKFDKQETFMPKVKQVDINTLKSWVPELLIKAGFLDTVIKSVGKREQLQEASLIIKHIVGNNPEFVAAFETIAEILEEEKDPYAASKAMAEMISNKDRTRESLRVDMLYSAFALIAMHL